MQQTFDRKTRKKMFMGGVIALSVLTVAGATLKSRSSLAAADKNSLKQQRAAMGMPDPAEMHARMLDDMAHNLGLTQAQKQQMKAAMKEGADPRSILEDKSLSREQKFERLGKMREEREARIRVILTPEQQGKYEQVQAQMRERFRDMGRSGRGTGDPGGFGARTGGFSPPPGGTYGGASGNGASPAMPQRGFPIPPGSIQ